MLDPPPRARAVCCRADSEAGPTRTFQNDDLQPTRERAVSSPLIVAHRNTSHKTSRQCVREKSPREGSATRPSSTLHDVTRTSVRPPCCRRPHPCVRVSPTHSLLHPIVAMTSMPEDVFFVSVDTGGHDGCTRCGTRSGGRAQDASFLRGSERMDRQSACDVRLIRKGLSMLVGMATEVETCGDAVLLYCCSWA